MSEHETNKTPANQNKAEPERVETAREKLMDEVVVVEKKVEAFEEKTDEEVEMLVNKMGFAEKIIHSLWMKKLLKIPFMEKSDIWVRKNMKKICKIFGWIGLVCGWLFTAYSIVMLFTSVFDLFKGSAGLFFLSLISIVFAMFILKLARGWLRMKKWLPALCVVCVFLNIIAMLVSIFFVKLHILISIAIALLSVIISIIITLYVVKNKDMFKN